MKPTTESIKAAFDCVADIDAKIAPAQIQLAKAQAFFESDSPQRCIRELQAARSHLAHLRRTQTAALSNIDEAIDSAKGGAR